MNARGSTSSTRTTPSQFHSAALMTGERASRTHRF
jgi:hypothetical protein